MHTALALPTVSPARQSGRSGRRQIVGSLALAKGTLAWALGAGWLLCGGAGCGLPEAETAADRSLSAPQQTSGMDPSCFLPATRTGTTQALNIVGGDMVVDSACTKATKAPGWPLGANGRHILFANFDGVDVRPGSTPGNSYENIGLRAMDLTTKGVIQSAAFRRRQSQAPR